MEACRCIQRSSHESGLCQGAAAHVFARKEPASYGLRKAVTPDLRGASKVDLD